MSVHIDITFLLGRLLLAGFFLMNAMNHFTETDYMAQYAESKGVPLPRYAVLFSGVLLAISGISFLLGLFPSIGIISATIFFVGVTPKMHDFWNLEGEEKQSQMVQFMKNTAILGAVLMFSAMGQDIWGTLGLGILL